MSFSTREARGIIRKAVKRVPEGEDVRHLNITAMMDMMTILLVTFIFQASVTSSALTAAQVQIPDSITSEPMPEVAATVLVTQTGIVVTDGKDAFSIVAVRNGDVDANDKEGGALGVKIPKLSQFLSNYRQSQEAALKRAGKPIPAIPELMIIADRTTPYRLLVQVIYSAKQKEAGYKRFRLIVTKHAPLGEPAK
ncbi:MAG: biopolymer transporter ExbD [Deltaproteobacteria bacterium]|nr:biopolymer transporter ExbD [Deltaproteobacteria bacterium]